MKPHPIIEPIYREIDKQTLAGNHETARLLNGLREEIAGIIEKEEKHTDEIKSLLNECANFISEMETAPNSGWWKRYFLFDGAHMILTEEGWELGCEKATYEKQASEDGYPISDVIFDEVNPPQRHAENQGD